MKSAARLRAATEVLAEVFPRHRPAALALADWGKSHRFAGSGDRAAIGNLVYDALRHKGSAAYLMGAETPRALVLGTLCLAHKLDAGQIAALCSGTAHALEPLSEAETGCLDAGRLAAAPTWVQADIPEWLVAPLTPVFGDNLVAEGRALAERAPVDLRANTLKATREQVLQAFAALGAAPSRLSPHGVRLPPPAGHDGRTANVEADPAHGRGWFEVQDEGSQIAAALTGAKPGQQVLDICAGAGGKTLALAAAMENQGQIHAYDGDKFRLRPIFERLTRAGVGIVEVLQPDNKKQLAALGPRFDTVLVDAPCSGSGVWRRRPDAKWRLKPGQLAERAADQRAVLAMAAPLVRPGGRLVYVTCSLLPEENGAQVAAFVAANPAFELLPWREAWSGAFGTVPTISSADGRDDSLLLTPARHATDGFFVAVMTQRA